MYPTSIPQNGPLVSRRVPRRREHTICPLPLPQILLLLLLALRTPRRLPPPLLLLQPRPQGVHPVGDVRGLALVLVLVLLWLVLVRVLLVLVRSHTLLHPLCVLRRRADSHLLRAHPLCLL